MSEFTIEKTDFYFTHPAVLIFGAGATRGAFEDFSGTKPPIDQDFFDIAVQLQGHGTENLAREVLKSVWELYGKTSGVSLEKYYRDIETRKKIGSFAKSANQPKDWGKRQSQLEQLIRRVLIHTTCNTYKNPIEPKLSDIHRFILNFLRVRDVILTFNYDLLIEESLPKNLWCPDDGYGVPLQGITGDWSRKWKKDHGITSGFKSKVQVLKLHGSLNWTIYKGNSTIRLKPRPYVVRTSRSGKPAKDKISILPPGWNKRIDVNPYKQFWREARLKLESCNSLVAIGYSLPDTDLLAQALFSEVVRLRKARSNFLKEIHLIDKSETVKEKLLNLFQPALGPYTKIFKYDSVQSLKELKRL